MTMTHSIEAVSPAGAVRPAETATLSERSTGIGTSADARSADAGLFLGTEARSASGLAALVAENSALGEALRSLPDALDVVPKTETEPVAAVKKPATAVTAETETEGENVVLQAASLAQASVVESATPVRAETATGVAGIAPVAAIDVSDMFLSAAEAVAAAVTVSPALMRGEAGEIRVQLQPDVLEGSEVVVAVDGRKMDVTFVPTVTHVADAILANQAVLQSQLVERIAGFEISVGMVQAVATNVATSVGSVASVRTALNNMRKSNGRS